MPRSVRPPTDRGVVRVLRVVTAGATSPWDRCDAAMTDLGADARTVAVGSSGSIRQPFDPRPVIRAVRRHQPDVVDLHGVGSGVAALEAVLLVALVAPRTPLVISPVGRHAATAPITGRVVLGRARGAWVPDVAAAGALEARRFRGVISVVPLGIDVGPPTEGREQRPTGGGRASPDRRLHRIGYIGRLEVGAGVLVLLSALAGLPDSEGVLVGEGKDRERILRHAHDIGVEDRVELARPLGTHDVSALLRTFDVLAVPPLTGSDADEEQCWRAVEAMAAGVPVVASATGALAGTVGDAGILVEPGNALALQRALREVATRTERRAALSEAAHRRTSGASWPVVAAQLVDLYRAVAASQAPPGQ